MAGGGKVVGGVVTVIGAVGGTVVGTGVADVVRCGLRRVVSGTEMLIALVVLIVLIVLIASVAGIGSVEVVVVVVGLVEGEAEGGSVGATDGTTPARVARINSVYALAPFSVI